jgi:hypothetical protein
MFARTDGRTVQLLYARGHKKARQLNEIRLVLFSLKVLLFGYIISYVLCNNIFTALVYTSSRCLLSCLVYDTQVCVLKLYNPHILSHIHDFTKEIYQNMPSKYRIRGWLVTKRSPEDRLLKLVFITRIEWFWSLDHISYKMYF